MLTEAGQSPWYDNIDRRFIKNGKLKELFDNGIFGVTSNPTIFEKAVSASDEYDKEIKKLSKEGENALDIYDTLTTEDITAAARLLRGTYEKTNHLDGYVSIEVLPEFAHDPEKTVRSAREIFKRIGMPNVMIKVPGTKESPKSVRALIKEGINVNVTLLFSVGQYEACAKSYIEGLRMRLAEDKDIRDVFSVASVFVSRVDTWVDKILREKGNKCLVGTAAIANSKMIYRSFKELFGSEDFRKLKSKGANIQRVLWASTSTKNPAYRDVKYVEELIGDQTVNTMPPSTVCAFLDHGKVELTLGKDIEKETERLEKLKTLDIDLVDICQQIQGRGVLAFQNSFDKLIKSIKQKMS